MVLGLAIGFTGSAWISQTIEAWVIDAHAADPTTLAAAGAAIVVTALLAAYGPSRRAARVDPVRALASG